MIVSVFALIVSLVLALVLVPCLASFARRVGLVDHPDKLRKLHQDSIPMVGGLALFIAAPIAAWLAIFLGIIYAGSVLDWTSAISAWLPIDSIRADVKLSPSDVSQMVGLLLGGAMLMVVGVVDDRIGMRGRQKLLGQFFAVTILILFGYQFHDITVAGFTIDFGIFSILVVYAWVIAAINSVNLLDGADGVASTIGIVMSLAICIMSLVMGRLVDAIVAASIAGSLIGFLKYNFPPAKVYLGDAGSMLIGFLLSALAMRCMFKQTSAYAFFAPVALLAIPFMDTAAAIVRRRLTGRSIFDVDRGHLHHTLMKRGYSPRVSLLWVALLCATTAAGGVISLIYKQSEYALASIAIVVIVMIGCKLFGVAELQLVSRKASTFTKSLLGKRSGTRPEFLQSTVHVQGSRDWEEIWKLVCDFADEHRLLKITMDLNAPWLHESFHATWRRSDAKSSGQQEWFSFIPLIVEGRSFGRIEILGCHDRTFSHHEVIRNILKVTEDIENSLIDPPPVDPENQELDSTETVETSA